MKRIGLFLGVEPSNGGMFQYAGSVIEALAAIAGAEYEVHIAAVSDAWRPILNNYPFPVNWLQFGKAGLTITKAMLATRISGPGARVLSSVVNPIAGQLRRMQCDFWLFPAQDAIAYQLDLPAIVSVHDLMHRHEGAFAELAGGSRFAIREHRFRNLAIWAQGIVVDSELGRTHVVASYGVDPAKIHVLPYIPSHHFYDPPPAQGVRSRLELPAKFFFYPAQFWVHKNHQTLVSAAASIRDQCPDIHLVFTGEKTNAFAQIYEHARALGMLDRITFLGYLQDKDLPEIYRRARALIMPTFLGPTNIPPLEALACDCPVAVSGIYAMPEQLGDAALYFNPRSVSDLAGTLQRLWQDDELCAALRAKGRRRSAAWAPRQFGERLHHILTEVSG